MGGERSSNTIGWKRESTERGVKVDVSSRQGYVGSPSQRLKDAPLVGNMTLGSTQTLHQIKLIHIMKTLCPFQIFFIPRI